MDSFMISLFFNNTSRGPGKVAKNLILGLNKLGVEFNVNPTNITNNNKIISLQRSGIMNTEHISKSIIGPNICVLPIENKVVMNQEYKKMIVPSQWVKDKYMRWLPEDKLFIWAVGIDTDLFSDSKNHVKTNDCLIYFKNRDPKDLEIVKNFLKSKQQSFEVISYGSYNQNQFIESIKRSKYGVIVGNTESQGVAIQEMMSSNLPLLVWDRTIWDGKGPNYLVPATTVPYWDESCGEKFDTFEEMKNKYNIFIENLDNYSPRKYVLDNLSIEVSTNKILKLINE